MIFERNAWARVPTLGLALALVAGPALVSTPAYAQEAKPAAQQPAEPKAAAMQQAPAPASPQQEAPQQQPQQQAAPAVQQGAQPAPQLAFPGPAVQQPSAAPSLWGTLFALVLVLALLLGLAWFMKRFGPRGLGGSTNMRVVGALNLGGRERILVVEVAGQWIVVGAAPGRVNLLTTMPKQEGVEPVQGFATSVPSGFADWLKQTIDKRNAK
jgi:flagellar protein FliO/FliZ